jgi:hypothetical protein
MIVAGCQNQRVVQPVRESQTVLGASNDNSDILKKVAPIKDKVQRRVLVEPMEPEASKKSSFLHQATEFIKGLFSR